MNKECNHFVDFCRRSTRIYRYGHVKSPSRSQLFAFCNLKNFDIFRLFREVSAVCQHGWLADLQVQDIECYSLAGPLAKLSR